MIAELGRLTNGCANCAGADEVEAFLVHFRLLLETQPYKTWPPHPTLRTFFSSQLKMTPITTTILISNLHCSR